ncbi:hypothetical protein MKC43_08435 [[Clostridium] innocuum]|nr:hypothetical protein [[Clostridium] innocuum]
MRIPILSEEAKQLLIEATKDAASQILVIDSLEGTDIQTYNKIMNIDKIGKSVANIMKFQKKFRSGIFVGIWYNRRDSSSTVKSEITR